MASRGSFFTRLADRTVLCPSTDWIDPESRQRELVSIPGGQFELWKQSYSNPASSDSIIEIAVLKFPGTGGRAELSGPHPIDAWPGFQADIWSVNPPGYGTSGGTAKVGLMPEVALAAWQHVVAKAGSRPVLVTGTSLGCVSALYLGGHVSVAGLLLRNPPPIHQLIRERWRYNWWNAGAARWVAREIPPELDALKNASRCIAPALFVCAERDALVPIKFQKKIVAVYAGPYYIFEARGLGHDDPLPESQQSDYFVALDWLRVSAGWNKACVN